MFKGVCTLSGKGQDRGFTLIELLIVILIIGILAAVAAPLYLGYVKDAKTAEGKSVAGALWTSVQANGVASCGTGVTVQGAFPRAGFTSAGTTTDGRWSSGDGANTINVDCASGTITGASPLFTLNALKTDISPIKVQLTYVSTDTPPAKLFCAVDGTNFVAC